MIFQSQLVGRVLTEAGQTTIDPTDLNLGARRVSHDIFIPCVKEYTTRKRPEVDRTIVVSSFDDNQGVDLPDDFVGLVEIKPLGVRTGSYSAPLPFGTKHHLVRSEVYKGVDHYLDRKRNKLTLPFGNFSVTYACNSQPTKRVKDWQVEDTNFVDTKFSFRVPDELACGFTLRACTPPYTRDFTIDEEGGFVAANAMEGDTDPVEITSLSRVVECGVVFIDVEFSKEVSGPLLVDGTASIACAPGLTTEDDELFYTMFMVKFGHAYANAKSNLQMNEMPININQDRLGDWIRQKETEYQRLQETNQAWWRGV